MYKVPKSVPMNFLQLQMAPTIPGLLHSGHFLNIEVVELPRNIEINRRQASGGTIRQ